MRSLRQTFWPHGSFLAALLLLAAGGVWRGLADWHRVRAAEMRIADLDRGLDRLDELQLLLQDDSPLPALASSPAFADDPFFLLLRQELAADPVDRDRAQVLANTAVANAHRRLVAATMALVRRQRHLALELATLSVALVLVGLGYYLAVGAALRQPLRALAATARQVSDGDLEARAVALGSGPAAAVAADFNAMVDVLVASLHAEEQACRDLAAANRHKSHFLANVSHELKTPLNAIIGFADILAAGTHGPLTPRQTEYARRIYDAGSHLQEMIADLIDAAQLDLGNLRLELTACDVPAVAWAVVELLRPEAAGKGQELALSVSDVPPARLDARRVLQIITNLVANAVKFTPAGGHVGVAVAATAGAVTIEVTDDGIGIEPADQERVFAEFVQLDSRLQRQHDGAGMGLALARRLAELMGGGIVLASTPGQGSTFTVTLPLAGPQEKP